MEIRLDTILDPEKRGEEVQLPENGKNWVIFDIYVNLG